MRYTLKRDDIPLLSQWINKKEKGMPCGTPFSFFGGNNWTRTQLCDSASSVIALKMLCIFTVTASVNPDCHNKRKKHREGAFFFYGGNKGNRSLHTSKG